MLAPDALAAKPAPAKKKAARAFSANERPEGMTNIEWAFDIQRRSVENASCCSREAKQAALMEQAATMAVPHTPVHPFVPAAWSGNQGSVSSLSPSPLFHDAQGNPPHMSRFSASCHDFDPLGGFNPNTFDAPNTFWLDRLSSGAPSTVEAGLLLTPATSSPQVASHKRHSA
jgi:hypothetical protein